MAKEITLEDCKILRKDFEAYCKTAEQHQFPMLLMIDLKMQATLEHIKAAGKVEDQKDLRAMFRVVKRVIGQDPSEYLEEEG